MNAKNNEYFPYAAALLSGLVVCLAIAIATGRKEAWDSGVYFTVGIPMMCALMFAIGYLFPLRPWRWGVSMAVGQSVAIVLGGGSLSLWPLALIAMLICTAPQFVAGLVGSRLARRRAGA